MAASIHRWREAVRRSTLSPTFKVVLLELGEFMDWETLGGAYPGPALLAKRAGVSLISAKRALKAGTEVGLLRQTFKGGHRNGERHASAYQGRSPKKTSVDPYQFDTGVSRDGTPTRITEIREPVSQRYTNEVDNPGALRASPDGSASGAEDGDAVAGGAEDLAALHRLVDSIGDRLCGFDEKSGIWNDDHREPPDIAQTAAMFVKRLHPIGYWQLDEHQERHHPEHLTPPQHDEVLQVCAVLTDWLEGNSEPPVWMRKTIRNQQRFINPAAGVDRMPREEPEHAATIR